MTGTNKIILNDETIAEMVSKHINAEVFKDFHKCIKVEKEYQGNAHIWVAYVEPVNKETK